MKSSFLIIVSSLLSACLLTLSSPPGGYDQWYLAYFALLPVLLSIPRTNKGFLTGWIFGFIYFLINLRWVITAVSEFGHSPFAVGVLVTVVFALFMGLFWGGVFGWIYLRKQHAPPFWLQVFLWHWRLLNPIFFQDFRC